LNIVTFYDLERILEPGDLLVVNDSRTLAASVAVDSTSSRFEPGSAAGRSDVTTQVRDHSPCPAGDDWICSPPTPAGATSGRLWLANASLPLSFHEYLQRHGTPITYDRSTAPQRIDAYQTVFARVSGSAEMPSAARPFTPGLVTNLVRRGVRIAPVTLHAGVSSLEAGERPYSEWYEVPPTTAALLNHTRDSGHRVVAVGTTVVRALETVSAGGRAHPGQGWTDLYITPDHEITLVDGLITGWHEPTSTHLEMLVAIAGNRAVEESYDRALAEGYLWHEFGDSHLILT